MGINFTSEEIEAMKLRGEELEDARKELDEEILAANHTGGFDQIEYDLTMGYYVGRLSRRERDLFIDKLMNRKREVLGK